MMSEDQDECAQATSQPRIESLPVALLSLLQMPDHLLKDQALTAVWLADL